MPPRNALERGVIACVLALSVAACATPEDGAVRQSTAAAAPPAAVAAPMAAPVAAPAADAAASYGG